MIFKKYGNYKKYYLKGQKYGFKIKNIEIDDIKRNHQKEKERLTREYRGEIKRECDRIRKDERERTKQMLHNEKRRNDDLLERLEAQYKENNRIRKEVRKVKSEWMLFKDLKIRMEMAAPLLESIVIEWTKNKISNEKCELTRQMQDVLNVTNEITTVIHLANKAENKFKEIV